MAELATPAPDHDRQTGATLNELVTHVPELGTKPDLALGSPPRTLPTRSGSGRALRPPQPHRRGGRGDGRPCRYNPPAAQSTGVLGKHLGQHRGRRPRGPRTSRRRGEHGGIRRELDSQSSSEPGFGCEPRCGPHGPHRRQGVGRPGCPCSSKTQMANIIDAAMSWAWISLVLRAGRSVALAGSWTTGRPAVPSRWRGVHRPACNPSPSRTRSWDRSTNCSTPRSGPTDTWRRRAAPRGGRGTGRRSCRSWRRAHSRACSRARAQERKPLRSLLLARPARLTHSTATRAGHWHRRA